ncbi:N-acetylmuramoyl-L-alanine amidase [Antrihabitans sp. NCIMB 15449]|uniref:N-acetylmuramoyl-L-alanine amidase n=1 Tax=Antrihabitans spumae TaxID=3373370 RepID=A0ABW7JWS6_9NOCA
MRRLFPFGLIVGVTTIVLAGCATPVPPAAVETSAAPTQTSTQPALPVTLAAKRVVVLDPGHNGGNGSHPAEIGALVPDGRGRTKPCNTTGTATDAGYPEHAFTWDVTVRVRDALIARGIEVVLTRPSDDGVGPCVDERAAIGNRAAAAAVVSIHADGATSPGAHGFHVAYSSPPLNPAQEGPSVRLAQTLRDGLAGAGLVPSTYVGADGLNPRADLAGLNLSQQPTALIECGNMRDPGEAETLSSATGRQRYADAIAASIVTFVG